MGRSPRVTQEGVVYHLLNRRVMRLPLFKKLGDYEAFEQVLVESASRPDAPRMLAYCLMPSHWHLVVQAGRRTNLSTWMQRLTVTHTHRFHAHHDTIGEGPLYQGRFKSFPVAEDEHFLTVCRYVEANAVRARLVKRAENWRWSSLWTRANRTGPMLAVLYDWPVDRPRNWLTEVNRPFGEEPLAEVRRSAHRGTPFGEQRWKNRIADRLGLQVTVQPRGRPRKKPTKSS